MALKGLTCYHMIVIVYGEGEAGKQGGHAATLKQKAGIFLFFPFG